MSKSTFIPKATERIEATVDDLIEAVQHERDIRYKPLSADGWIAVKSVVLALLADLDELDATNKEVAV